MCPVYLFICPSCVHMEGPTLNVTCPPRAEWGWAGCLFLVALCCLLSASPAWVHGVPPLARRPVWGHSRGWEPAQGGSNAGEVPCGSWTPSRPKWGKDGRKWSVWGACSLHPRHPRHPRPEDWLTAKAEAAFHSLVLLLTTSHTSHCPGPFSLTLGREPLTVRCRDRL